MQFPIFNRNKLIEKQDEQYDHDLCVLAPMNFKTAN